MNINKIVMDKFDARKKYLAYLEQVKARQEEERAQARSLKQKRVVRSEHLRELETLKETYRYLSKGESIIDINDAMRRGGTNHEGHPRLAIARAHKKWVKFYRDGGATFCGVNSERSNLWGIKPRDTISFRQDLLPGPAIIAHRAITAMVPLVPIEFMPRKGLSNYHILFEPEWKVVAPEDPILLKHLGGPMYLAVAEWNLTDIEKAVLFHSRTKN